MTRYIEIISGWDDEVVGTARIRNGKLVATGIATELPDLKVIERKTFKVLTPADGDRYLDAVRSLYRNQVIAGWKDEPTIPIKRFDPDQPRDESGRWASDGGGGGATGGGYDVDQFAEPLSNAKAQARLTALGMHPQSDLTHASMLVRGRVVGAFEKLHARFPRFFADHMIYVGVESTLAEGRNAYASADLSDTGRGYIRLDPNWFADTTQIEAAVEKDHASGWFPKETEGVAGLIEHEFGHLVDRAESEGKDRYFSNSIPAYRVTNTPVSTYGRTNNREWFAETFAAIVGGREPADAEEAQVAAIVAGME